MTVLVVVLGLAVLVLAVRLWYRSRHGLLVAQRRRRVLVTLKTGQSFAGVLIEADGTALLLQQAEALGMGDRGGNVVVDGSVLILTGDVAFVQLP